MIYFRRLFLLLIISLLLCSCAIKKAGILQNFKVNDGLYKVEPIWEKHQTTLSKSIFPIVGGSLGFIVGYNLRTEATITTNSTTKVKEVNPFTVATIGGIIGGLAGGLITPPKISKPIQVNPTQRNEWLNRYNFQQNSNFIVNSTEGKYLYLSQDGSIKPIIPDPPNVKIEDNSLNPRNAKCFAWVIGNANYSNGKVLNTPVNDAEDVTKKLDSLGFNVYKTINLSKKSFEKAILSFKNQTMKADVIIIYYVGYGVNIDNKSYFLPIDARLEQFENASVEGISLNTIINEFKSSTAKVNLFYLDVASINIFKNWGQDITMRAFTPIERTSPFVKIYNSTQSKKIPEISNNRNSIFTGAFLKNISENVDSETLMKKITQSVNTQTKGKQIPWSYGSLINSFKF